MILKSQLCVVFFDAKGGFEPINFEIDVPEVSICVGLLKKISEVCAYSNIPYGLKIYLRYTFSTQSSIYW